MGTGKPHPVELRERAVAFVERGNTHTEVARRLPTLHKGDVVILDNRSSHKSPGAARALRDIGAWCLFLPPCSPDLNPIEMAFAKLKTLLRKADARTYDQLWQAVGRVCGLFTDEGPGSGSSHGRTGV